MFEELYAKIEQYLIENNISNVSEIKEYCDEKVKDLFKELYPDYLNAFNDMNYLIEKCIMKISKTYNIEKNEAANRFISELDLLLPNWKSYIDINNLANAISDVYVERFYKNKYKKENFEKEVTNFSEALINTININTSSGYRLEKKEDLRKLIEGIFNLYFNEGKLNAFTSKNGARDYVTLKGEDNILKEMKDSLKISDEQFLSNEIIKKLYINEFVSSSSLK